MAFDWDSFDNEYGHLFKQEPLETEEVTEIPYREDYGIVGEVGSGVARGVTSLLELGAEGVEGIASGIMGREVDLPMDEWLDKQKEERDFLKPSYSEYHSDSLFSGLLPASFSEQLTQSLGAAAPGAAFGGMVGGPVGAAIGGLGSTLLTFGLGEGRNKYEELIEKGFSKEEAFRGGVNTALIDGGIEGLAAGADIFTAGFGGKVAKAALKQGAKKTARNFLKMTSGEVLEKAAIITGTENITEQIQSELGAREEMRLGLRQEGLSTKDRLQNFITTTAMSLVFAGGATAYSAGEKAKLKKQLASESLAEREQAASQITQELNKSGDVDLAKAWKAYTDFHIRTDQKINLDEEFLSIGEKLSDPKNLDTQDIISENPEIAKAAQEKVLTDAGINPDGSLSSKRDIFAERKEAEDFKEEAKETTKQEATKEGIRKRELQEGRQAIEQRRAQAQLKKSLAKGVKDPVVALEEGMVDQYGRDIEVPTVEDTPYQSKTPSRLVREAAEASKEEPLISDIEAQTFEEVSKRHVKESWWGNKALEKAFNSRDGRTKLEMLRLMKEVDADSNNVVAKVELKNLIEKDEYKAPDVIQGRGEMKEEGQVGDIEAATTFTPEDAIINREILEEEGVTEDEMKGQASSPELLQEAVKGNKELEALLNEDWDSLSPYLSEFRVEDRLGGLGELLLDLPPEILSQNREYLTTLTGKANRNIKTQKVRDIKGARKEHSLLWEPGSTDTQDGKHKITGETVRIQKTQRKRGEWEILVDGEVVETIQGKVPARIKAEEYFDPLTPEQIKAQASRGTYGKKKSIIDVDAGTVEEKGTPTDALDYKEEEKEIDDETEEKDTKAKGGKVTKYEGADLERLKAEYAKTQLERKKKEEKKPERFVPEEVIPLRTQEQRVAARKAMNNLITKSKTKARSVALGLRDHFGNKVAEAPEGLTTKEVEVKDGKFITVPISYENNMYHGTSAFFDGEFKEGRPIFFTEDKNHAQTYAGKKGDIKERTISLKNPYVIDFQGREWTKGPGGSSAAEIARRVNAEGKHDGVVYLNIVDPGSSEVDIKDYNREPRTQVAFFSNKQISDVTSVEDILAEMDSKVVSAEGDLGDLSVEYTPEMEEQAEGYANFYSGITNNSLQALETFDKDHTAFPEDPILRYAREMLVETRNIDSGNQIGREEGLRNKYPNGLSILEEGINSQNESVKALSTFLSKFPNIRRKLRDVEVKVGASNFYRAGENTIYLTGSTVEDTQALHEVLHSFTANEMQGNTQAARELRDKMDSLLDAWRLRIINNPRYEKLDSDMVARIRQASTSKGFKDNFSLSDFGNSLEQEQIAYSLLNRDEFLAQGLSNPAVMKEMKAIQLGRPVRRGNRVLNTIWDMFVDTVRRALGLNTDTHTMLDEVLYNVIEIGETLNRSTERLPESIADATESQRSAWREWARGVGTIYLGPESVANGDREVGIAFPGNISEMESARDDYSLIIDQSNSGMWVYGNNQEAVDSLVEDLNNGLRDPELSKRLGYSDEQREISSNTTWPKYVQAMNADMASLSPAEVLKEKKERLDSGIKKHFDKTNKWDTKGIYENFKDKVEREVSETFQSTYEAMATISKPVAEKFRRMEMDINENTKRRSKKVRPFLDKFNKLSARDQKELSLYLFSEGKLEEERKNEMLKKFGMISEYKDVENMLNESFNEAEKHGVNEFAQKKSYYPRYVKRYEDLVKYLRKEEDWGSIQEAIAVGEENLRKQGIEPGDNDRAQIVTDILATGRIPTAYDKKPSALKARTINTLSPGMIEYYASPSESLGKYIVEMTEKIEKAKTLGTTSRKAKMKRYKQLAKKLDKTTGPKAREKMIAEMSSIVDSMPSFEETLEEGVGALVYKGIEDGTLKEVEQERLKSLIRSRITQSGAGRLVSGIRTAALLGSLTQVTTGIRQISDNVWTMYRNGMLPTLKAAFQVATGSGDIKENPFDFQHPMREFSDTPKLVDKALQLSGIQLMDNFGKRVNLQATINNAKKVDPKKFNQKWEPVFGENTEQVMKDLKAGKMTEDVKYLLFSEISNFQPISLLEMPPRYLRAGNGRIFYLLKSYSIKSANNFYRESIQKIRNGNKAEGMKNLMKLGTLFILANASSDWLIDWLNGREPDFTDSMVESLLTLGITSRYTIDKGSREGYLKATVGNMFPPTRIFDAPFGDLVNLLSGEPTYESMKLLPFGGTLLYNQATTQGRDKMLANNRKKIIENIKAGNIDRGSIASFNKEVRGKEGISTISAKTIRDARKEGRAKGPSMMEGVLDLLSPSSAQAADQMQYKSGASKEIIQATTKNRLVQILGQPGIEGYKETFYVPSPKSGVTIGAGVDFSGQSRSKFSSLGVPKYLLDKLDKMNFYGKRGASARAAMKKNKETLTKGEVAYLSNIIAVDGLEKIREKVGDSFFSTLSEDHKAVALSLYHIYDRKWFKHNSFKQFLKKDWKGLKSNMENYGDKSKGVSRGVNNRHRRVSKYISV